MIKKPDGETITIPSPEVPTLTDRHRDTFTVDGEPPSEADYEVASVNILNDLGIPLTTGHLTVKGAGYTSVFSGIGLKTIANLALINGQKYDFYWFPEYGNNECAVEFIDPSGKKTTYNTITEGYIFSYCNQGHFIDVETAATDLVTGDKFQMGMYPQTEVTDSETITALAAIDCTMTSYGYIKNTTEIVDMTYADIVYNGEAYRKVTITENRPYYTTGDPSGTDQTDNGYNAGETYYFKYEPIVWQVLAKEADGVYVMSKSLLDSQAYNDAYEDTTWENCTLRTWLNDGFYNTAFSDGEKGKIVSYTHENEDHPNYNTEGGNDTTDNLWVLSYSDAINTNYGFSSNATNYDEARRAQGTDYAKSQGIWVSTSSAYLGNSEWWLRTPGYNSDRACEVNSGGYSGGYSNANYADLGIRPAFKLDLNATVSTSDTDVCRIAGHSWGAWTKVDESTHKRTCSVCSTEETKTHNWLNGKCSDCGAEKPLFTGKASDLVQGDIFQMGMYPQTRVTDSETLTALDAIDCTMKSYGYIANYNYDNGEYDNVDMTYGDIVYNDEVYRKVTVIDYRPSSTESESSAKESYRTITAIWRAVRTTSNGSP